MNQKATTPNTVVKNVNVKETMNGDLYNEKTTQNGENMKMKG
jgi:hypothetical protein